MADCVIALVLELRKQRVKLTQVCAEPVAIGSKIDIISNTNTGTHYFFHTRRHRHSLRQGGSISRVAASKETTPKNALLCWTRSFINTMHPHQCLQELHMCIQIDFYHRLMLALLFECPFPVQDKAGLESKLSVCLLSFLTRTAPGCDKKSLTKPTTSLKSNYNRHSTKRSYTNKLWPSSRALITNCPLIKPNWWR